MICLSVPPPSAHRACCVLLLLCFIPQWKQSPWISLQCQGEEKKKRWLHLLSISVSAICGAQLFCLWVSAWKCHIVPGPVVGAQQSVIIFWLTITSVCWSLLRQLRYLSLCAINGERHSFFRIPSCSWGKSWGRSGAWLHLENPLDSPVDAMKEQEKLRGDRQPREEANRDWGVIWSTRQRCVKSEVCVCSRRRERLFLLTETNWSY